MNLHLKELGYDFQNTSTEIPSFFETKINETVDALAKRFPDGTITEKLNSNSITNEPDYILFMDALPDYLGYEASQEIKVIDFLGLGLEILKRLSNKLSHYFPKDRFCLIMEFSSVQEDIVYPGLEACDVYCFKNWDENYDHFNKMDEWYLGKDYTIGLLEIKI